MKKALVWFNERVPLRYLAWAHAFLALGIGWGHAIAIYPPASYDGLVDLSSVFRMGVLTGLGSLITIVGMFMTRARSQRRQHRGLWIELVGTILLGGGPLQYFGIQVGFLFESEFDQRYAIAWFAYAMGAFILVRFSIIIPALIAASRIARTNSRRSR